MIHRSRMKKPLAAAIWLLLATGAWAQPQAVPQEKLDEWFTRHTAAAGPGMVLAVIQDGRMVYQKAGGLADLERAVPLSPESVFDIASNGKQFTACAVLLLAEEGRLDLDADLRHYIPEFPDYGTPITLRHLLHHTSGIRDYPILMLLAGKPWRNFYTCDDYLQLLQRQKRLNFPPGTKFEYSNSGYFLLGEIVARVSGRPLEQFLQERIFAPLGMRHTRLNTDAGQVVRQRAIGYSPRGENEYATEISQMPGAGDGGLLTTVGDLQRWEENFWRNRLGRGGPELIRTLCTPGRLADDTAIAYAMGLETGTYRGLPIVRHGGGFNGYRSEILRFPEQRLSIVCLANLGVIPTQAAALQVADLCLAGSFRDPIAPPAAGKGKPKRVDARGLAEVAGAYRNPQTQAIWVLSPAKNGLLVRTLDGAEFTLEPRGGRVFRTAAAAPVACTVRFLPVRAGGFRMEVEADLFGKAVCEPLQLVSAADVALADYEGGWESEELGGQWQIRRTGQGLVARIVGLPQELPLEPTARDQFRSMGPYLIFTRDDQGRVIGLTVTMDGATALEFRRR